MARNYEDWLRAYSIYTSALEAPAKFHFWSGVSAIAGALQGKCWIDMGKWKWKPNFYIIFVAPPGIIGKSTTSSISISLLRGVDGVFFGPDSTTWQSLLDVFVESAIDYPMPNGDLYPMASITLSISELGVFLDPQNREQMDMLVHMWDGADAPLRRRTRADGEKFIRNPWLNLIGCTTPAWIAEYFPEYAIGGGFTSRAILLFGDHKRNLTAYPRRAKDAHTIEKMKETLLDDLKTMSRLSGEFALTESAFKWGEEWYEQHWMNIPDHLRDARMGGYVARKQTHIHKLAMILSVARRDDLTITETELSHAENVLTSLESDLPRIFSNIGDSREAKVTQFVLQQLGRYSPIKRSELWRRLYTNMSLQDFDTALSSLIQAEIVAMSSTGPEVVVRLLVPQDKPAQSPDMDPVDFARVVSRGT
jgi:hypothetical protein